MNIALAHFRVGETDGVSLEMDKWKLILERIGHKVYFLAGSTGETEGYVIPELHYKNEVNNKIVKNAYNILEDYKCTDDLEREIISYSEKIQHGLEKFVEANNIDILVPNNIWSLGWGLPAGLGFYNAVKNMKLNCIVHNHDFHWERDKYSDPTCAYVRELLKTIFPPQEDYIKHVVINRIAQNELFARRGIKSTVVPNVFDFQAPSWTIDEYNKDFRENIGISKDDIIILQATRIAERKAIELAVDVIGCMHKKENIRRLKNKFLYNGKRFKQDSKIVFVMAGIPEAEPEYIDKLNAKAEEYGIRVVYVNDCIAHTRTHIGSKKCYSLWDAYVHADLVTYPSILEGWGNQFLEAIFAKKPVIVYEYPVYVTDLKSHGFDVISLGNTHEVDQNGLVTVDPKIIEGAAVDAIEMLLDPNRRSVAVEKNFKICEENFSYRSLERLLGRLFN